MLSANDGFAGVMASDTRSGCPTLTVADPLIDPEAAVMVALPMPLPVLSPVLTILATLVADELQLTLLVRSCVPPSLYVPIAVNCWFVPFAIEAVAGVTDNDVSTGAVTVNVAEPLIDPELAVIVVAPRVAPVASPLPLTVAVVVDEEVHVAVLVRFCVVPLL